MWDTWTDGIAYDSEGRTLCGSVVDHASKYKNSKGQDSAIPQVGRACNTASNTWKQGTNCPIEGSIYIPVNHP